MIIDDLVRGSIDMHCHHAPDALIEGRMDAYETVKLAAQMGMRAVVLKSTYFPTMPMAEIIGKLVPEVKVFGSVCLDHEIGGLNFHALEPLAKFGTKVVWMPTHSSTNSRANMRRLPGVTLEGEGYSRGRHKNCRNNIVDIIKTAVVRVAAKCEVTTFSHYKVRGAT